MPIYLKIDGIDGNVTAEGHEKWIELDSMQFGVGRGITSLGSVGRESDREASVASISEITVSKLMDETTPLFFIEACIGVAKSAQIHLCRTGDKVQSFMEYKLRNVLISSYSVEAPSEGHPEESLSFNFDKIEMKYIPADDTEKAGSPIPAGYDLQTAKKV